MNQYGLSLIHLNFLCAAASADQPAESERRGPGMKQDLMFAARWFCLAAIRNLTKMGV